MRALAYFGPGKVSVVKKPDPGIEHPQDVVLRVTRAAICGSDLHLLHGLVPDTRVGCTFGHEFTGVVEDAGRDVRTLKRGDRVVVPFNIACGRCFFCERGLFANCENTNPASNDIASGVFGYSHTTGGFEGGQAEYVRVPFADVGPTKIPDDMHDEEVLFLSDILPTGYQAAEMGEIAEGRDGGGLRLRPGRALRPAVRVAHGRRPGHRGGPRAGAARVRPRVQRRRDAQLRRGGRSGDGAPGDDRRPRGRRVHRRGRHGGRGEHVAGGAGTRGKLQAGAATALAWCIQTARKGGNVSIVGVYGPPWNLVPIGTAMNKGLTLRMNQCNVKRYVPHLLKHIREGRIDARRIITHRFPLARAPDAYHLFEKRARGCIKCVLLPQGEA